MSVRTKADMKLDDSVDNISKAIKNLLECMNSNSFYEYNKEYQSTVEEATHRLINIKHKLNYNG